MFYCESCREAKGWPESFRGSRGPCEVCGKVRDCHDVASRFLPDPRRGVSTPGNPGGPS